MGRCKPDPAIFLRACGMLGVDPERTLMVGDSAADAGAARVGCATLVLPAARAGAVNGLRSVLDLTLPAALSAGQSGGLQPSSRRAPGTAVTVTGSGPVRSPSAYPVMPSAAISTVRAR